MIGLIGVKGVIGFQVQVRALEINVLRVKSKGQCPDTYMY